METVLVTGSRGFTGRYLCAALAEKGYRVVGLVRGSASTLDEVQCDLSDPAATNEVVKRVRPDRVVHLAAIAFVGHGCAEEFYRVNLFGTLNLIEAIALHAEHVRQIVVASSATVYGNVDGERIDESHCPLPVDHYGISKLAMEYMLRTWFNRLPILIARPFNYTGPGQNEHFLVPKIVKHFSHGYSKIELGNLDVARDFSDVRDVVEIYSRLLESDIHSEVVNICSGRAISLREILDTMQDIAGYSIEVRRNRQFVRQNEIRRMAGDNSKLLRLVGSVPTKSLSETLYEMYEAERPGRLQKRSLCV
ncbi:GDP-mannose 4,6-dehydratase [Methylocaldum szegediense]|uniref:GDP-6-deoxy-D-talose 4-dehydrogenase n=1 Tax=Methylocaldum szegediense TaxID=73780 RepID=A0ABM9I6N2_9GAMM|nr:GDP-mannose 4,6-dehydratase [Methylocaldum szegediense]CAI8927231.1 GDP-6-deoxy-D-talose 4-dehydrogenase [Methylocaldum szegediense]